MPREAHAVPEAYTNAAKTSVCLSESASRQLSFLRISNKETFVDLYVAVLESMLIAPHYIPTNTHSRHSHSPGQRGYGHNRASWMWSTSKRKKQHEAVQTRCARRAHSFLVPCLFVITSCGSACSRSEDWLLRTDRM